MGELEDLLADALKYTTMGGKMPPGKLMAGLIKSVEMNVLTQVRDQLNKRIQELAGKGVDAGDDSMNPFVILGISPNATKAEVDKAYREKAGTAHPDKGGSNEEMMKVNAAREAIYAFKKWKK